MSKIKHPTKAERLGRWFGGVWRGLVRRDARLAVWLNGKGLSIEATKVLIWFLRLVFLVCCFTPLSGLRSSSCLLWRPLGSLVIALLLIGARIHQAGLRTRRNAFPMTQ